MQAEDAVNGKRLGSQGVQDAFSWNVSTAANAMTVAPVPVERPPEPLRLDWWPIVLPLIVFFLLASFTKGRVLLMLPLRIVFRRGGFSGGRSGGGGAGGRT